jgi:hypothetical protein
VDLVVTEYTNHIVVLSRSARYPKLVSRNTHINRRPGTSDDSNMLMRIQRDSGKVALKKTSLPKEKSQGNESPVVLSSSTAE